ncbi:AfsR/SARP family transcriptional regulator [Kocuria sabuli]|uniref:AfsR/SARP family transcriptional regulator n=1 Tax=Kocuria sabuli TaxID=3071448 RepID=UPI0034D6162C
MDVQGPAELTLLGGWQLRVGGAVHPMGIRQQRLLAALAVFGPRSRRFLAGRLWPECTEAHALGSLRAAVFTVSRRLPGLLVCSGSDLRLGDAVDVDLHRLRRALASTVFETAVADPWWFASASSADLLPGWYDDWVVTEQRRLHDLYLTAAECLAETALARDDHFHARHLAEVARSIDPLRESATGILIRAHLAMDNEATALAIFHEYATVLADELGARPSPHIVELVTSVGLRFPSGPGTGFFAAGQHKLPMNT